MADINTLHSPALDTMRAAMRTDQAQRRTERMKSLLWDLKNASSCEEATGFLEELLSSCADHLNAHFPLDSALLDDIVTSARYSGVADVVISKEFRDVLHM